LLNQTFSNGDPGDENDFGASRERSSLATPVVNEGAQNWTASSPGIFQLGDPGDEDDARA
jgi:hypothetical protein